MGHEIIIPEKYAFVGAACVGKTTLLEKLRTEFATRPDVAFIEESAREYFTANPTPIDQVFSFETQKRLQDMIIEREKEAHTTNPIIIFCDRSVLDSPAHVEAMGDIEGGEKLLENVRFWLPTYKLFLLLDPSDIPYRQDEVRRESEDTRNMIHQIFQEFLIRNQIPFQLLSGTIEGRVAQIKELMEEQ